MLATFAALGCDDPVSPPRVDAEFLQQFDPPQDYVEWWREVEECTGLSGDFHRIRWFLGRKIEVDGRPVTAAWVTPHDIYLHTAVLAHVLIVKHEMIHDLIPSKGHESPYFTQCVGSPGD